MSPVADGGAVNWSSWNRDAFARARAQRKPILLSIVAPWSAGCREMDRVSYADAATAALINLRAVAIRVDADERPDVADRYDLGGLPTTAFLDADGRLLGGGTFVAPARLRAALERVIAARDLILPAEAGSHTAQGSTQLPPSAGGPAAQESAWLPPSAGGPAAEESVWLPASAGRLTTDSELLDLVFSTFDETNGGFGDAPKFPFAAPVRLAIDLCVERNDARMREIATRTLDAMGGGALYDEQHGGCFRCSERADWTHPQREKLLSTNAALLDLYLHAGAAFGEERYVARAADLAHYIDRDLSVPGGGWRVSDGADGSRQFSDSNGHTASALLRAAAMFKDDGLGQRTLDAFERVLLSSYKPGEGVGHQTAGVRGLLGDQVAMAAASLDAWESTGRMPYRMMAEELMHYAIRTMWDEAASGFRDRAAEESEPIAPVARPFLLNCDAAVVLHRLASATGERGFAERADTALDSVAHRAAEFGPLAASYLLARRNVV